MGAMACFLPAEALWRAGACAGRNAQLIRIHLEGRGRILGSEKIDDGVVREFGWGEGRS